MFWKGSKESFGKIQWGLHFESGGHLVSIFLLRSIVIVASNSKLHTGQEESGENFAMRCI